MSDLKLLNFTWLIFLLFEPNMHAFIRHKIISNSAKNLIRIKITGFTLSNESTSKIAKFVIIKNSGLVGSPTSWTSITDSLIEYNTESTSVSGGQSLFTTLVGSSSGVSRDLNDPIILEPGQVLAVHGTISNSAILSIGMTWLEEL